MGPVGRRKIGGQKKGAKLFKTGIRKKFEARHVDQVWQDVRKLPADVHGATVGPAGTTDR
jgi:bud site selection protein 20